MGFPVGGGAPTLLEGQRRDCQPLMWALIGEGTKELGLVGVGGTGNFCMKIHHCCYRLCCFIALVDPGDASDKVLYKNDDEHCV